MVSGTRDLALNAMSDRTILRNDKIDFSLTPSEVSTRAVSVAFVQARKADLRLVQLPAFLLYLPSTRSLIFPSSKAARAEVAPIPHHREIRRGTEARPKLLERLRRAALQYYSSSLPDTGRLLILGFGIKAEFI